MSTPPTPHKTINVAISAIFLVFIFGLGIAFWILPDTDFSADENRTLQTFPEVSADGWLDGSVSAKLTDYYSDQFPLRPTWVSLHALGELAMGRGESGGVLLGDDGQLATRRFDAYMSRTERAADTDYYNAAHIQSGLDAVIRLDETLDASGIPLCVLLPPRTLDVTQSDFAYPALFSNRLDAAIRETLAGTTVNHVDLLDTFRTMHESGRYVYYRTDHHWTTQGAYTAYGAVLDSWGMGDDILPANFFTVRQIPGFAGTAYSRAGMFFVPTDTLEIWEATDGSDARYTVRDEAGRTIIEAGFINEKYLSEKDKYSAFLDGTHRLLTITDEQAASAGESRPRLLLARDSFANSMVPFLARHFDIVMVNLSGGMTQLSELAATYDCDRVLIVCNWENLITSDCLALVR